MIQIIATFANIRDVNQLNIFVIGKIAFTRQNVCMGKLKSLLLSQRTNKLCWKFCLPLNPDKYITALVVDIQLF